MNFFRTLALSLATFFAWSFVAPEAALAIPVFANGQGGVDCDVVRNSIILVEFIQDERKEAAPLRDALTEFATARTRPIFLLAAAGAASSLLLRAR